MKKPSTVRCLQKMTLRTIRQCWAQFLAIIAIGAIAVTLFVGLLANAQAFENQVNTAYENGNLASLWVTTSVNDEPDLKAVTDLAMEVCGQDTQVDSRLYIPATANGDSVYMTVVHDMPSVCKPYEDVNISEKDYEDGYFVYVDKELVNAGTSFSMDGNIAFDFDLGSYYTSVTSSFISALDSYVIEGGTNIFAQDKITLTATITGSMSYPENLLKSTYNSSVILVSDLAFRRMIVKTITDNFGEDNLTMVYSIIALALNFNSLDDTYISTPNQFLIKMTDESKANELKKEISDYFAAKDNNNLYIITKKENMPFYVTLNNDVTQARQFTFVFPFVFFLVAVLVILTTLSQMILKERKEIGTMKAIGLSKFQIYYHYISLTQILVLIGTVIGEIIGPLLIPGILGQKYLIIYSLPERQYTFPWLYGIITLVGFLAVTVLVTYLLCHREVSLKPSESMRPAPSRIKAHVTTANKKDKVFQVSAKMAVRNIFADKMRSLMVIIGVLGCTALLVCGFGIEDTVNYGIDHDMTQFRSEQLSATFAGGRTLEDSLKDVITLSQIDQTTIEPSITSTTSLYLDDSQCSATVYVIANADENSHFHITFADDEVGISQKIAKKLNAKEGDEITFDYNNVSYSARIGTIYEAFFYHGLVIHRNFFIDQGVSLTYTGLMLDLKDGEDPSEVAKILDEYSYITDTKTQAEWKGYIADVMSGVFVMTNAVKVFAILLAIVVLYNLALMNFKERTRDIATLKVLGFNRVEISFSLMLETMFLTAVGVLFGSLLGYPFLLAVMGTNVVEMVEYLYVIQFLSYFLAFLLTYVLAFFVNLIFSLRTKRIPMVESLKSVE